MRRKETEYNSRQRRRGEGSEEYSAVDGEWIRRYRRNDVGGHVSFAWSFQGAPRRGKRECPAARGKGMCVQSEELARYCKPEKWDRNTRLPVGVIG